MQSNMICSSFSTARGRRSQPENGTGKWTLPALAFVSLWHLNLECGAIEVSVLHDTAGNLTDAIPSSTPIAASIKSPPVDKLGRIGGSASFSVSATGTQTLSYQWRRGGADISGATGATLFLPDLVAADFASYTVVVSNSAGSLESLPAVLLLDADDDHLGDAWETASFGDTTAQHGGGDADADGVSNEDEFADGTDPASAASRHFTLNVTATKGGMVAAAPVRVRYAPATTVTLTAMPEAGVQLLDWSGDASGSAATLTLTMDQDRNVTASFGVPLAQAVEQPGFTWSTGGDGPWRGLLTRSHDGIDAANAPLLAPGKQSLLEAQVTGQGKVTFWVGSSRVDLQACKLEYSIVSPK